RLAGPVQPDRKRLKVGPLPLHGLDVVGATPQIGQPSVVLLLGVINIAQPAMAHHEDVGDGLVLHLIEDNLAQRLTVVRRALLAVAVEVDEIVVLIGVWNSSFWHGCSPPKIHGYASLGSALGFFKRSLIEAKRAPKRRVPRDDFHSFSRVATCDMNDSS